ncbi:MAG TPA: hypothetical protein VKV15_26825 [Bryobacteraceae bacterium]|nr:hypothetical protein [Bryobacteraceae bacterium]
MRRGYSRDHRSDCEPMVIAPIVNREGFPFSSASFCRLNSLSSSAVVGTTSAINLDPSGSV